MSSEGTAEAVTGASAELWRYQVESPAKAARLGKRTASMPPACVEERLGGELVEDDQDH